MYKLGRSQQTEVSKNVCGKICLCGFWTLSSGGITVRSPVLLHRQRRFPLVTDREDSQRLGFTYVQGMNVLAAPFLYTMPSEVEAFFCFAKFIEESCPLYVQPTLEGVHRGLKLLDRCLKIVDPELFQYLRSKNLSAELYAFPCQFRKWLIARTILTPVCSCVDALCMHTASDRK